MKNVNGLKEVIAHESYGHFVLMLLIPFLRIERS